MLLQGFPAMSNPLIVSVLLNTNRKNDTLECLTALYESSYDNHRVIVLDNGSTDGSVEVIRSSFPDAQLIQLNKNLGFSA